MEDGLTEETGLIEMLLGGKTALSKSITACLYILFLGFAVAMAYKTQAYPKGDEGFYTTMAGNIGRYGLYSEMAKGNPIGYTLPLFLISHLLHIGLMVAGRILSFIAGLFMFWGIRTIARRKFGLTGAYLQLASFTCLLSIVSAKTYFFAGSDFFFTAFFIWILVYVWNQAENWKPLRFFVAAGLLVSLSALVRPLALPFFSVTFAALCFVAFFGKGRPLHKVLCIGAYFVAFVVLYVLQQYPSLKENGSFASERKIPDDTMVYARHAPDTIKSNWTERLALTNVLIDQNKKKKHVGAVYPTWQETDAYLAKNGTGSLPSSPFNIIKWNPNYLMKHLLQGCGMMLENFLRESGIVFVLPFIFLFMAKEPDYRKFAFFSLTVIGFAAEYVFIALNFVEIHDEIIPMLFLGVMGTALVARWKAKNKKLYEIVALVQLVLVFADLLMNIRYNFMIGKL